MGIIRPPKADEIAELLWRRKLVLLLFAAVALAPGVLLIKRLPKLYEARALVIISGNADDDGRLSGPQTAAVSNRLNSSSGLSELIRKHKLYPLITSNDDAVAVMSKAVRLEVRLRDYYPQLPEAVAVSFRYEDPQTACAVVNDLIAAFNQVNDEIRTQATTEIKQFNLEITQVENGLAELRQRQEAAARSSVVRRPAIDPLIVRAERMAMASSIDALRDQQTALELRLSDLKKQISAQQQVVSSLPAGNSASGSSSYGILLARKAELEAQLRILLTEVTDKHPKVQSTRVQLDELTKQLQQFEKSGDANAGRNGVPEERELRELQRRQSEMQTDLEVTRRAIERKQMMLASMPDSRASEAATTEPVPNITGMTVPTEYSALLGRLNSLLDKRNALMRRQNLALFQIVDRPVVPQVSVAPKYLKLYPFALAIALALGLLAVIVAELPRRLAIRNERDAEFFLGVPVMALVPRTYTIAERSRLVRLKLARNVGVLLLALTLAPALLVLLNLTGIFQLLASK
ncbi:MAG: hypothetical protein U0Z53_05035 [Blastocatellia bacterium]